MIMNASQLFVLNAEEYLKIVMNGYIRTVGTKTMIRWKNDPPLVIEGISSNGLTRCVNKVLGGITSTRERDERPGARGGDWRRVE